MATLPDAYKKLLAGGRSLNDQGLHEVALSRADALQGIAFLQQAGVRILGGDVWVCGPGYCKYADSWCVERRDFETQQDLAERSWRQSVAYIGRCREPEEGRLLFVIVTP